MSAVGQTRPSHSAPAWKNGRYASDSDQTGEMPRTTLSAISDRCSFCRGLDRTEIHGTDVPVEEPSTASKADFPKQ